MQINPSPGLKKVLLFVGIIFVGILLYCVDVVSDAVYANQSIASVKNALANNNQDPLLSPGVAQLAESISSKQGELSVRIIKGLIELKSLITPTKLKAFLAQIQTNRASSEFGVSKNTLLAWDELAQEAQSGLAANLASDPSGLEKNPKLEALKEEVNKVIISKLAPQPQDSVKLQYLELKKFVSALPELPELFSNTPDTN